MIGLEMLLLLAFQAVYGYVYQQLAVVIAAFMAGMALGSWLGDAAVQRMAGCASWRSSQVLAAAAPLVLLGLFEVIGRAESTLTLLASQIAFPALALGFRHVGRISSFRWPAGSSSAKHAPPILWCIVPARSTRSTLPAHAWARFCSASGWFPCSAFFKTAVLSALVSLAAAMATLGPSAQIQRRDRRKRPALAEHQRRKTEPPGPTLREARKQSIPPPEPRSTTVSPGRSSPSAVGFPHPSPRSASTGMRGELAPVVSQRARSGRSRGAARRSSRSAAGPGRAPARFAVCA